MSKPGYMLEQPSIPTYRALPALDGDNGRVRPISREVVADPSETTRPALAFGRPHLRVAAAVNEREMKI